MILKRLVLLSVLFIINGVAIAQTPINVSGDIINSPSTNFEFFIKKGGINALTIDRWSNIVYLAPHVLRLGHPSTFGAPSPNLLVDPVALASRYWLTDCKGVAKNLNERWLTINERNWTGTANVNSFTEGTYINSRLVISNRFLGYSDNSNGTAHIIKVSAAPKFAKDALVSIDGLVYCDKIICQPSGSWPDYVFDQSYKRLSLKEVDEYIKVNKHLPNIPSAQEIVDKGLDLADMQKLQMEKIEELTLYLIELQKQNEEMKKEIELLRNK